MLVTVEWMKSNYDRFNAEYWEGSLPSDLSFKVSRSSSTWGYASYEFNLRRNEIKPTGITMSNYYDSPEEVKLATLLHEMIHIADYHFHPWHFICNGRKVRGYDAHGPLFFQAEASRLKAYGWNIDKYVQDEEETVSKVSDMERARIDAKLERGVHVFVVGFKNLQWSNGKRYGYCKVGPGNEDKYKSLLSSAYKNGTIGWLKLYGSRDVRILDLPTSRGGSINLLPDIDGFIEKYGLYEIKTLFGEDVSEKKEGGASGKMFVMPLTNGGNIEIRSGDPKVVAEELRRRYPKWKEEVIMKIVTNRNFYRETGLDEDVLRRIVNESISELISTEGYDSEKDPMVHTVFLGDGEGVESIV